MSDPFRILAVDDDPGIREIYRDILQAQPATRRSAEDPRFAPTFEVQCCCQAAEAVDAVAASVTGQSPYAAVFLDVNLPPGPSGIWAAEQMLRIDSSTHIVLVTGYIGSELGNLPAHLRFSDRLLFLEKPFHPQEIVQFATALTAKWVAERQVRALHQDLEDLVGRRTAELVRTNERLRREIDHRKHAQQELQESLGRVTRMIGGTVLAIAAMVEKRDPYTSGHQVRVAELARAIGRELNLPAERLEGLFIASAIHDIGKISLPAEILSKPSQLNVLEKSLIQAHSQSGYDILKVVEFPWPVATIVLQHHERLNGTGYPQGLAGDTILLEARIVGVADVVETMSSHRPYRPSVGLEAALDEISSQSGVLYDPDAVDACIRLIREKRFEFTDPVFA